MTQFGEGLTEQPVNPVNLSAERSVLGALIENDSLLQNVVAAGLKVGDFALSDHRRVFNAILKLRNQKKPVDYILVAEHLGNRQEDYVLVGSLSEGVVLDANHLVYHVEIVRKKARLRTLLRIGDWLTRNVTETADADDLIAEVMDQLETLKDAGLEASVNAI